jgi:hypothetical protein
MRMEGHHKSTVNLFFSKDSLNERRMQLQSLSLHWHCVHFELAHKARVYTP